MKPVMLVNTFDVALPRVSWNDTCFSHRFTFSSCPCSAVGSHCPRRSNQSAANLPVQCNLLAVFCVSIMLAAPSNVPAPPRKVSYQALFW